MKRAKSRPRLTTQEELDRALELRHLGQSLPQIARETGIPLSTVGVHLKGIPAGTPQAHPPIDLHSPFDTAPAPTEGDSDPFSIVRNHGELLAEHGNIGVSSRRELATIGAAIELTWKEIEDIAWVSADMLESAIKSPIRSASSDGEVCYEAPTEDEALRRRLAYTDQINRVHRNRIGTIHDLLKASQLAIKIEREAAGLDYVQELAVSLARVMSAGYTVEG